MIIGHLPSGYIVVKSLQKRLQLADISSFWLMFWGLFGAIAPDLDLFYFYFIDSRQHHHHSYWTHFPLIWFSLLLLACGYRKLVPKQSASHLYICLFLFMGCIHLVLDTMVGDIRWLAPLSNHGFCLFTVPALYTPWWLNFILHWSFLLELILLGWAIDMWRQTRKEVNNSSL